jgi:hypothetical protein
MTLIVSAVETELVVGGKRTGTDEGEVVEGEEGDAGSVECGEEDLYCFIL